MPHGKRGELLSAADETRLAKLIERGDVGAKQRMIEANLRLVAVVARSYRGRGAPFVDLVQEGTIGLAHAVERFDYRRGLKFSTYAVWWIRRSVLDAVASAELIRLPPAASQHLAAVRRAEFELESERRAPSPAAIADRTGLNLQTIRSLQSAAQVTRSLDEPIGVVGTPLVELVADDAATDPADQSQTRQAAHDLSRLLACLPKRQREVLERRYGLSERCPESHRQIAFSLGIGEERSRQIEHEALRRLRSIVGVQK
jgi:RNA polymerase primary sigma factor